MQGRIKTREFPDPDCHQFIPFDPSFTVRDIKGRWGMFIALLGHKGILRDVLEHFLKMFWDVLGCFGKIGIF